MKDFKENPWGCIVKISTNAPSEFRPRAVGSVCGVSEFPDPAFNNISDKKRTGTYYTVEFGDGYSVLVHEDDVIVIKNE